MKIEELLEYKDKALYCIHPDESIFNCIKILNAKRLGALIVITPEEDVIGIITERDILRITHETRGTLDGISVKEVMSPKEELSTASTWDDIGVAMEIMTQKKVRHLPIVDNSELKGILAIGEVGEYLLTHALKEIRELKTAHGSVEPN
jgi:CBS domain-containing protein